jgi:hypothetical protein
MPPLWGQQVDRPSRRMAYLPGWLVMRISRRTQQVLAGCLRFCALARHGQQSKTEQPEAHGHNFCRLIFISRILSQACRMQPSRHASSDCCPIHSAAGKLKPQVVQVAPGVCRFGLRDEIPVQKVPAW